MTNKETIHKLIMFRRILERGVFPVGYIFDAEPFDLAISALEKQEPMKPMAPELDPLGGVTHPCGNCGGELVSKFHDFCPWCGQAIKWEK